MQQKFEIYDYPGQYGLEDRGNRLAKIHLEAGKALEEQANGSSTCPRLVAGFTFKLDGHDFKARQPRVLAGGGLPYGTAAPGARRTVRIGCRRQLLQQLPGDPLDGEPIGP